MPQVFISGSRSLARLPEAFCQSIDRICEQGFGVLVGDSERGVDALTLDYLRSWRGAPYPGVRVFTVRTRPRVTVDPAWAVEVVAGEPGTTGRALQTAKDRVMGERADWGLAYFNPIEVNRFGNLQVSSGTLRNAVQLLLAGRPVKLFYTYEGEARAAGLSTIEDLEGRRGDVPHRATRQRGARSGAREHDRVRPGGGQGRRTGEVREDRVEAPGAHPRRAEAPAPCRPPSTSARWVGWGRVPSNPLFHRAWRHPKKGLEGTRPQPTHSVFTSSPWVFSTKTQVRTLGYARTRVLEHFG